MEYLILVGIAVLGCGASVLFKLLADARFRARKVPARGEYSFGDEFYLSDAEATPLPMSLGRFLLIAGLAWTAVALCGAYFFRPAHWTVYTYRDGGFQVEFPESPRVRATNLPTLAGSFTLRDYTARRLFRVSFGVQYVDLPAAQQDSLAGATEQIREALSSQAGATVLRSTPVTTGPASGQELLIHHPGEGVLRIRTYIVGSRLYTVTVSGLPRSGESADAERFLGSFKLMQ